MGERTLVAKERERARERERGNTCIAVRQMDGPEKWNQQKKRSHSKSLTVILTTKDESAVLLGP